MEYICEPIAWIKIITDVYTYIALLPLMASCSQSKSGRMSNALRSLHDFIYKRNQYVTVYEHTAGASLI